jgi:hypothetical protein
MSAISSGPAVAQYGGLLGLRYNFESGEYGSSVAD